MCSKPVILIKGAGEVASGIAHKLAVCHFRLCLTDLAEPTAVRRGVTFSEAVFDGQKTVEGVTARLVKSYESIPGAWEHNAVPLLVDPSAAVRDHLKPDVLVDATMAKKNSGTRLTDARVVIGVGPGFRAGVDCHAVVETNRGHHLGRVILDGEAEPNTGIPAPVLGVIEERVIRSPAGGALSTDRNIGEHLREADTVGSVTGKLIKAETSGVLRGLLRNGARVWAGMKIGDIDPRNVEEYCFTISDKSRAIAGGVLEAILSLESAQGGVG
ncbi:MAG: EF2563 family selenium-dependent molybdenum hydroxylase system protein [Chloroflexi bacterium]|nr:EF2563 family selenium-dependent molybdenum hydroxylase system protein [Chloroflexota bacterium]